MLHWAINSSPPLHLHCWQCACMGHSPTLCGGVWLANGLCPGKYFVDLKVVDIWIALSGVYIISLPAGDAYDNGPVLMLYRI